MIKHFPELEFFLTKSTNVVIDTIKFQETVIIKSLEYFNKITDRTFHTYVDNIAENLTELTDNAKENISKLKSYNVFGSGKTK